MERCVRAFFYYCVLLSKDYNKYIGLYGVFRGLDLSQSVFIVHHLGISKKWNNNWHTGFDINHRPNTAAPIFEYSLIHRKIHQDVCLNSEKFSSEKFRNIRIMFFFFWEKMSIIPFQNKNLLKFRFFYAFKCKCYTRVHWSDPNTVGSLHQLDHIQFWKIGSLYENRQQPYACIRLYGSWVSAWVCVRRAEECMRVYERFFYVFLHSIPTQAESITHSERVQPK